MADVQRQIPAGLTDLAKAHELRDELAAQSATIGARCLYIKPGNVDTDITLEFDVAPSDAALDAALAAYPRTAANITSPVAVVANTPAHIKTINLAPGDHISINVYIHVSMILGVANTRDEVLVGLAPIWRETDGTLRWSDLQFVGSGQVPGFDVDLVAAQLDNTDVGVSLRFNARASGTVVIVGIQVTERTRANIP